MSQYRGLSPAQAILEILSKGRSYGMGIRAVALERDGCRLQRRNALPCSSVARARRLHFCRTKTRPCRRGKKKVFYELTSKGTSCSSLGSPPGVGPL